MYYCFDNDMRKIIILGGGNSAEREVSLVTAQTIKENLELRDIKVEVLDPADYSDWVTLLKHLHNESPEMIFIGLHGAAGEDGRLQGMLEICGLPFTGSGSRASALAMDKNAALCLATDSDISVAPRQLLFKEEQTDIEEIIRKVSLPLVVKPNSSGSSVGIRIVDKQSDLMEAISAAWELENYVLCEQFIAGRELTVTILDGKALPVVEIKPLDGWYDYTNKYIHGKTEYICPAELTQEETLMVQKQAELIFRKLGCQVYGRVDFRYDGNRFCFLEVNTLPGMTSLSLTPMAAKAADIQLPDLLLKIIELSKNKKG